MTVTVQSIIDKAQIILQDTGTTRRWDDTEMLKWINEAHSQIVMLKPDAYVQNQSVILAAGTKQSLPTGGLQLIDVIRNMGTGGATAGAAIVQVNRKVLDNMSRSWHTETQQTAIEFYTFDERNPKNWYCYPPSDGTGYVEEVYSSVPAQVTLGGNILLDDVYHGAILQYLLYRSYAKDADFTANQQRAESEFAKFLRYLGMKEQAELAYDPNRRPEAATTSIANKQ